MEDLSHGKSPQDASVAHDQARRVRRQSTNPPGCRSPSSPSTTQNTTLLIVERYHYYRELANQLPNRSAVATAATLASECADLPALVPCLSSSSDSSEEEEEYWRRETQGMYWRHLDADA